MEGSSGIALITGATGGIGSTCARAIGQTMAVFVADLDRARLDLAVDGLRGAGVDVVGSLACDLADEASARQLIGAARALAPLRAVIHAAGMSPALGDAEAILRLNTCATEALLLELEQKLEPGLVAVILASVAGHLAGPDPEIDTLCAAPASAGLSEEILKLLSAKTGGQARQVASAAYTYSKRSNILSVQRRASTWGKGGARIVSISPGLVDTPMGRREVAEEAGAGAMLAMQPFGWVTPEDIAATASFLVSEAARSITGCDVRVDGGATGAIFAGRATTGACAA